MKIFHGLFDGTKDVVHSKYENFMPILIGNPGFTTTLSATVLNLKEYENTLSIIQKIGRKIVFFSNFWVYKTCFVVFLQFALTSKSEFCQLKYLNSHEQR